MRVFCMELRCVGPCPGHWVGAGLCLAQVVLLSSVCNVPVRCGKVRILCPL